MKDFDEETKGSAESSRFRRLKLLDDQGND